jgi:GNAT acetyltransferase-like protein
VNGWLTLEQYAQEWAQLGDGDPYFRPEFLTAAAVAEPSHPSAFAHGGVLYPFLLRELPDGRCDLTSAYGFGGPWGEGEWRDAFLAACADRGVVSEFVRFHPVRGNQRIAGDDVSLTVVQEMVVLDLDGDDDELVRRMVPQARNKLRKASRAGVVAEPSRDLERFWGLYSEAMRALGASAGYLFPLEYFQALDALGDGLLMLDAGSAAALFLCGGGAMHYFLAASTDEGRRSAATNLVIYEAMRIGRDTGLRVLNLGGGVRDGDALQAFKRSFGPGRAPYVVGSAIHDVDAYRRLSEQAGVDPDDPWFPAYRRPAAVAAGG